MSHWDFEIKEWEQVGDEPEAPKFLDMKFPVVEGEIFEEHKFEPAGYENDKLIVSEQENLVKSEKVVSDTQNQQEDIKETNIEELLQSKFEEGRIAGLNEANESITIELQSAVDGWNEMIKDLSEQLEQFHKIIEQNVLNLTIDISKKILQEHLKLDKKILLSIISDVISENLSKTMEIRLGGPHVEWLMQRVPDILEKLKVENFSLIEDTTINNGCVLDIGSHQIQFNHENLFSRIEDLLSGITSK